MGQLYEFLELKKKQVQLEVETLRSIITHSSTKGSGAENIICNFLRKFLPKRYSLGSGFVLVGNELSPQMDIIIYDEFYNIPIYSEFGFGVYPVESVYGVVEVTMGQLDAKKLAQDIQKHAKLRKLVGDYGKFYIDIFSKKHSSGKGYVVDSVIRKSILPPRSYICAVAGTKYSSIKKIIGDVRMFTKKYSSHIHGLIIIDRFDSLEKKDYVIWNRAYEEEVEFFERNALFKFIEKMQVDLLGMGYVGHFSGTHRGEEDFEFWGAQSGEVDYISAYEDLKEEYKELLDVYWVKALDEYREIQNHPFSISRALKIINLLNNSLSQIAKNYPELKVLSSKNIKELQSFSFNESEITFDKLSYYMKLVKETRLTILKDKFKGNLPDEIMEFFQ